MIRLCFLMLLFIVLQNHAWAENANNLQKNRLFKIETFLNTSENIPVGGKLTLTVEVATHRWFVGGTKISPLIMNNMVVGPIGAFATNFSRRENGVSWTVQHWSRNIYPLKEGTFTIPAMTIEVTVAGKDGGAIKGTLLTEPLQANTIVPAEMAGIKGWINAQSLTINEHFSRPLNNLNPGDVIEHTIITKASGIPAMMLPSPNFIEIDGLARYPSPPKLIDNNNRGQQLSSREDKTTYIVENEGRYLIPAREVFWWNAMENRKEKIQLPEREILTEGEFSNSLTIFDRENKPSVREVVFYLSGAFFFLCLLYLLISSKLFQQQYKQMKKQRKIIRHWSSGEKREAMALYYNGLGGRDARSQGVYNANIVLEQILSETYGERKILNSLSAKTFSIALFPKSHKDQNSSSRSATTLN